MKRSRAFSRRALAIAAFGAAFAPAAWAQAPTPDDADKPDMGAIVAVELKPRPALTLSGAAKWDDGLETLMSAIETLRGEAAKGNLSIAGPAMTVFTETDDQGFKYTAMAPLAAKPEGQVTLGQNVQIGETPAGKTMKFEHRGAYDDIDASYEAITAYLDEKGLDGQNLFIEEYKVEPKSADDDDMEVDIYVFLK